MSSLFNLKVSLKGKPWWRKVLSFAVPIIGLYDFFTSLGQVLAPKMAPTDEPDTGDIEDFPAMTIDDDRVINETFGTMIITPACIVQGRPDRKRIRKSLEG